MPGKVGYKDQSTTFQINIPILICSLTANIKLIILHYLLVRGERLIMVSTCIEFQQCRVVNAAESHLI